MIMNTPQEAAHATLGALYFEWLQDVRDEVYDNLQGTRDAINFEQETRESIQERIRGYDKAISCARELGEEVAVAALITGVQELNRLRHTNRENIKDLSFDQGVNKALLAELNREISRVETFMVELEGEDEPYETRLAAHESDWDLDCPLCTV